MFDYNICRNSISVLKMGSKEGEEVVDEEEEEVEAEGGLEDEPEGDDGGGGAYFVDRFITCLFFCQ